MMFRETATGYPLCFFMVVQAAAALLAADDFSTPLFIALSSSIKEAPASPFQTLLTTWRLPSSKTTPRNSSRTSSACASTSALIAGGSSSVVLGGRHSPLRKWLPSLNVFLSQFGRYAQAHPDRCKSLLLRGVFLFGPDEVEYLFDNGGTFGQNPEAWSNYKRFIQESSTDWPREQTNLLGAYWKRLTGTDLAMRQAAAAAFVGYELSISKTFVDPAGIAKTLCTPTVLIPFAVMEVHYMLNGGFMKRGQLLDNLSVHAANRHIVRICHGRADYVCQPQAAFRLSEGLKALGVDVQLEFVSGAGHSDSEPGLVDAMVRASDGLKSALSP